MTGTLHLGLLCQSPVIAAKGMAMPPSLSALWVQKRAFARYYFISPARQLLQKEKLPEGSFSNI